MSISSNQDSSVSDENGRLVDLSLYEKAYGKGIRMLADGSKSNVFLSNESLHKEDAVFGNLKKAKRTKTRQRFNVSEEFGSWVYKVQNARLKDNKIVYQKRYLYLKDDILYYSHQEFNPAISLKKCTAIPLSNSIEYNEPSVIQDEKIQNNKSIDIHFEDRFYTFVSDDQFPNSANFIMIVSATLKRMKEFMTCPEDLTELNRLYVNTLNMLGIPEKRWTSMIENEDPKRKWELIVSSRQQMVAGDVLAQACVNFLKQDDIQISEIRELRTVVGTSQKSFLEKFFNLGGLAAIQQRMYQIIMNENRSRNDILILLEFMPIIQSILKTRDMLMWFLSVDNFVETLVLCAFIKNNQIIIDCFTYLSIICNIEDGYNQVVNAFDDFMIFAQEKTRFQSVITLLRTASDSEVVITLLVFFNTLIEKSLSVAQRMAIYTDLFLLDYPSLQESLEQKFPASTEQIHNVFDVFLKEYNDDRQDVILSGIDTSDVEAMILTIQNQTLAGSNWAYLCSLLRSLLVIPYDNLVGRSMWRMIVTTTNQIVTSSMKETQEFLSNQDILELINKKQILDEKYEAIRDEDAIQEQYRQQIHELQDQLDEERMKVTPIQSSSDFTGHLVSDLIAQCSNYMEVSYMRDDPIYGKYFVMLESGVSIDDIAKICVREGNDESIVRGPAIKLTPKPSSFPQSSQSNETVANTEMKKQPQEDPNDPRNKPEYKKWFKLLSMHIPKEHIVLKMQQEGIDPSILDYASQPEPEPTQTPSSQPQEDPNDPRNKPEYKKWFKLLSMHIPKEHIVLKMQQEGVDPSILDYASQPTSSSVPQPLQEQQVEYNKPRIKKEDKPKEEKKPKSIRRKTKREPETKMKNIYWDAIDDDKIDDSAWSKMDDNEVDIDYTDLTNYFRAKENLVLTTHSMSDTSARKQEVVQLITDDKRLRNVSMAIARLKISTEVLIQAIYRVDDSILDSDMIRILFENAPTPEEIEIVKGYDGKIELLGDVDRFFKQLSTIPNLQTRLKCIRIRNTLKNDLEDIRSDFDAFDVAIRKCYESHAFYSLLQVILTIGNYMNGTTTRGGMYGFQISFLPRLADIKSVDNKTTLLEYIYHYMEDEQAKKGKNKDLINIIDDFKILFPLKGKDYSQLQQEFKKMNDNFELVGKQRNMIKVNQDDRFSLVMSNYYDLMKDDILGVKRSLENVDKNYQKFCKKYACPNDYKISTMIDDLSTFFQQFVTIREEIMKKRAIEEELKRSKLAKERMQVQMKEQKRKQHEENENDLMDSYQTMKKNQLAFHSTTPKNEITMPGTLKTKIHSTVFRSDDVFNSLMTSQRRSNRFNSPLLSFNTLRTPSIDHATSQPNSPERQFSFNSISHESEDHFSSTDQLSPPPNIADMQLLHSPSNRKSIFHPKSPMRVMKPRAISRELQSL